MFLENKAIEFNQSKLIQCRNNKKVNWAQAFKDRRKSGSWFQLSRKFLNSQSEDSWTL